MPSSKNGARQADPAFQFYVADYLNSEKVRCMDWAEKGVYVEMLCLAWQNYGLPGDHKRLATMLRIPARRLTKMMAGPLGECWTRLDGRLFNPRMERERGVRDEFRDRQSLLGQYGAAKRDGKVPEGQTFDQWLKLRASFTSDTHQPTHDGGHQGSHDPPLEGSREGLDKLPPHPIPSHPIPERERTRAIPKEDPNLAKVLAESMPPAPSHVRASLLAWGVHSLERTERVRGASYWRGELQAAVADPSLYAKRVSFSIGKDAKNVLTPSAKELAEWQAKKSPDEGERLTARGAQQRRNQEAGEAAIAAERERNGGVSNRSMIASMAEALGVDPPGSSGPVLEIEGGAA